MTDSTIEDPHAEAGAHLGAAASGAVGIARLATALLNRQRAQRTRPTPQELVKEFSNPRVDDQRTEAVLSRIDPAIGSAYRDALASGAGRKMAMLEAAERSETIVAQRNTDGAFVVSGLGEDSKLDARHLDDTLERARTIRTEDGTLHGSLGSHTELEWAAIDGKLTIDALTAERARRFAATSASVDTSALKAASDARNDARDAEATPDDLRTVNIDEQQQGQTRGGVDRARANSYVNQAYPAAAPDLTQPPPAASTGPAPTAAAAAKAAKFRTA